MKLADFDYSLSKHLIAQVPVEPRIASRLLVLDCRSDEIAHCSFSDIKDCLQKGDLLVLNDSRVLPAKITGRKTTGGRVELLLIKKISDDGVWGCLVSGRKLRPGTKMIFEEVEGTVIEAGGRGRFVVKFNREELLPRIGTMPLPPYIKQKLENQERYQTVYSRISGSLASTTAGLHFTDELLEELRKNGLNIAFVTLHVGISTFLPVPVEADLEQHRMEPEYCRIDEASARMINSAEGRIVAVGTTVVKALESACINSKIQPFEGFTDLFIYPGYGFKARIGAMITNFHLPRSTLLMLVCAYAGRERILRAYEEAIKQLYRFYSFGDAMLILK